MSDEEKDVTPEETPASESSAEEQEAQPEKKETGIPHARVKEMVEKAKVKGREEALTDLLEEQKPEKEEKQEDTSNELDQARKIIKEAVDQGMKPYVIRQEVEKFLDKTPDALNYLDTIKTIKRKAPELSWNEAYKLASHEDKMAEAKAEREAKKVDAGKPAASTEKPAPETPYKGESLADKLKNREVPLADLEKELNEQLKQRQSGG